MKLTQQHFTLKDFSKPHPLLRRLFQVVKITLCPGMSYRQFIEYYLNSKPHCMQITFLRQCGEDVGFFTCTYAFQELLNSRKVICRVAIGIISKHQKGGMPFAALCRRIIFYKLRYPLRKVYLIAYLANPFVYAAIAKYTAAYWPNKDKAATQFISALKENLLMAGNLKKNEVSPFVLKIHFHVQMPETLLQRIYTSINPDVLYYLSINPDFKNQMGVMTIIPVGWGNIMANIWKAMIIRPLKKYWLWCRKVMEVQVDLIRRFPLS